MAAGFAPRPDGLIERMGDYLDDLAPLAPLLLTFFAAPALPTIIGTWIS